MSDPKTSKRQKPYAGKIDISGLFDLTANGDGSADEGSESKQLIPIELVHRKPEQIRRYFDPQKMEQLTASVKTHGILENLVVRPMPEKVGEYELVAGERRYRAAVSAGLNKVPVIILELTDEEALQIALIENLQREDLNPVEETEGILQLLGIQLNLAVPEVLSLLYRMQNNATRNSNHNVVVQEEVVVEEVFKSLGLMSWQSFIKHRIPLLNLPQDILDVLRVGKIAYTKAQAIARVKDEQVRQAILEAAIAEDLSLTQIKERIAAQKAASAGAPEPSFELKSQMDATYRRVKKSNIWNDPSKQKQLKKLLAELEALISEGETKN